MCLGRQLLIVHAVASDFGVLSFSSCPCLRDAFVHLAHVPEDEVRGLPARSKLVYRLPELLDTTCLLL